LARENLVQWSLRHSLQTGNLLDRFRSAQNAQEAGGGRGGQVRSAGRTEIPVPLLDDLRAWQRTFDRDFHPHLGWISPEAEQAWAAAAVGLEARLREAVDGRVEVQVELWPLDHSYEKDLTCYWFEFDLAETPSSGASRGVGLTAPTEADARGLISDKLFNGATLPSVTRCVPDVDIRTFDPEQFWGNMELPNESGIWYPRGYQ
jgi:hypothetical protein